MYKRYIKTLIAICLISFVSCKPNTNSVCMYGIDSLTSGANGKSFRNFFDKEYKSLHKNLELGYIHFDYATSKDLNNRLLEIFWIKKHGFRKRLFN